MMSWKGHDLAKQTEAMRLAFDVHQPRIHVLQQLEETLQSGFSIAHKS